MWWSVNENSISHCWPCLYSYYACHLKVQLFKLVPCNCTTHLWRDKCLAVGFLANLKTQVAHVILNMYICLFVLYLLYILNLFSALCVFKKYICWIGCAPVVPCASHLTYLTGIVHFTFYVQTFSIFYYISIVIVMYICLFILYTYISRYYIVQSCLVLIMMYVWNPLLLAKLLNLLNQLNKTMMQACITYNRIHPKVGLMCRAYWSYSQISSGCY